MLLTRRAILLLLLFVPLLAAAAFAPAFLPLSLLYLGMVLGMLFFDWRLSPRKEQFAPQRRHDQRLSLGADNQVIVSLEYKGARRVNVELRDEYPPTFDSSALILDGATRVELTDATHTPAGVPQPEKPFERSGSLAPGETGHFRYTVMPPRRGNYLFGDISVRWSGVLGLIRKQATYRTGGEIKVYPNLLDIKRYELLAKRGHLTEMGLRRTRILGGGTEFERLRDYNLDDEYRKIDWKATARRSKPIVRVYETERSQNIMILLDTGRLMRAPVQRLTKLDFAVNAALMLAYVAGIRGDRVGMLTFADDAVNYLAPKNGKGQFQKMLGLLYAIEAQPVEASYARAIAYLNSRHKKRSLVVVFTDISSGLGETALVNQIALLAPRHVPLVVTLSDSDVVALAGREIADSRSLFERALAEQSLNGRELVMQSLRQRGVHTLDVSANRLTIEVINRYLELKARGQI
jgi:uncharacterized protein (DUF58 family)